MTNCSGLVVYEPLETLPNSNYWNIYVEAHEKFLSEGPDRWRSMSREDRKKLRDYILKKTRVKIVDLQGELPESPKVAVRWHKGTDAECILKSEAFYFIESGKTYVAPCPCHILSGRNEVPGFWFLLFRDVDREFHAESDGYVENDLVYKRRLEEALGECKERLIVLSNYCDPRPLYVEGWELMEQLKVYDKASYVELHYSEVAELFSEKELEDDHSAAHMESLISAYEKGLLREGWIEMERLESICCYKR